MVASFSLVAAPLATAANPTGDKKRPASAKAETAFTESESLALAAQLAERIEDADFRSGLMLAFVEFQLRQGQHQAALVIASTIPDYRRGVAFAKIGATLARAGKLDETADLLEKAKAHGNFTRPWQGDAVLAEVVIALMAASREEEGNAIAARLTDDSGRIRARSGSALEKARRDQPYDEAAFQFSPVGAKPGPERLQAARALLEIAELKSHSAGKDHAALQAIAPLCDQVETILRGSRAFAGEEYLDLGLLWRRMGDLKNSARAVGEAVRQMPPGVELQDWREGYFAKLVRAYTDAGDRAAVEKMLATARRAIPSIHEFYQPPALCQLAEAELAAGQSGRAEQTWLEATRIARGNPNPSSQYFGCAQVAFSVARANRPLSAELKNLLGGQMARSKQAASIVEN